MLRIRKEEVPDEFVAVPELPLDFFFFFLSRGNLYMSNCGQVSVPTAKHNSLLITVCNAHGNLHHAK